MAPVTDLVRQRGPATRSEINEAVYPALPADLVRKGLLSVADAAEQAQVSEAKFKGMAGLA